MKTINDYIAICNEKATDNTKAYINNLTINAKQEFKRRSKEPL